MKRIPISKGKYAIVDDDKFELLSSMKWWSNTTGYVVHSFWDFTEKKTKKLYMHRFLMNAKDDQEIDHINGDPADNRILNLRLCTHAENLKNQKTRVTSVSGYRGVCFNKASKSKKKYIAIIQSNGKSRWIGRYRTAEEAAVAWNEAAKLLHGAFSRLNKVHV